MAAFDNRVDVPPVDASILTPIVRRLLKEPTLQVTTWSQSPLAWTNIMPSGLHRFQGEAKVQRNGQPTSVGWSAILKVFQPPGLESARDPAHWAYWKREAMLYRSGLLSALPCDLQAPQFGALIEQPDGSLCLWMEEVVDAQAGEWSLAQHALASRHFGQLGGAYLTKVPLPDVPGQSKDWLGSWVSAMAGWIDANTTNGPWARPIVRAAVPDLGRVLKLRSEADLMLGWLQRLPRTFCHLDGWRANLLARRGEDGQTRTVAIDWMFAGVAAVGEEPAGTIGGDLFGFAVEPDNAYEIETAVLDAYVNGIGDVGWTGDERLIHFGYNVAFALRYGLLIPRWAEWLTETERVWLERKFGRSMENIAAGWGVMLRYALDKYSQAKRLAASLGLSERDRSS